MRSTPDLADQTADRFRDQLVTIRVPLTPPAPSSNLNTCRPRSCRRSARRRRRRLRPLAAAARARSAPRRWAARRRPRRDGISRHPHTVLLRAPAPRRGGRQASSQGAAILRTWARAPLVAGCPAQARGPMRQHGVLRSCPALCRDKAPRASLPIALLPRPSGVADVW